MAVCFLISIFFSTIVYSVDEPYSTLMDSRSSSETENLQEVIIDQPSTINQTSPLIPTNSDIGDPVVLNHCKSCCKSTWVHDVAGSSVISALATGVYQLANFGSARYFNAYMCPTFVIPIVASTLCCLCLLQYRIQRNYNNRVREERGAQVSEVMETQVSEVMGVLDLEGLFEKSDCQEEKNITCMTCESFDCTLYAHCCGGKGTAICKESRICKPCFHKLQKRKCLICYKPVRLAEF